MRAKLPHFEGRVDSGGTKIHYEIYGAGPKTMVFLPPWCIFHSRVYKAQIPYFSEHFRCVTYDGRGNGKSERPSDAAAYSTAHYVDEALAVMDATETDKAILVGLSFGGLIASILAAHHPDRAEAAILCGTVATIGPDFPYRSIKRFLETLESHEGWDKFNRDYWLTNYPEFAEHFVRHICSEPHSTKQIEDGIGWATETTGATLARTIDARRIPPEFDCSEAMYSNVKCPVLVLHGDDDQIQPFARGQAVAAATGAEFVAFPGGGHNPLGRAPAKCNELILDFLDRKLGTNVRKCRSSPSRANKKALYRSLLEETQ